MEKYIARNQLPIGVFDSGMGGLTVLRELVNHLPYESFIYLGDTARLPTVPRVAKRSRVMPLKWRPFWSLKELNY